MTFHLTDPMPLAYERSWTLRIGQLEKLIALLIVMVSSVYRLSSECPISGASKCSAVGVRFGTGDNARSEHRTRLIPWVRRNIQWFETTLSKN